MNVIIIRASLSSLSTAIALRKYIPAGQSLEVKVYDSTPPDCNTDHHGSERGVLDIPLPRHLIENPSMVFSMGPTGVFGYTGLTQADQNKLLYWSVYETALPDRDAKLDRNRIRD
ncbi:hypothetical protein MGN70_005647 [Eutypa lata]|nr:hypothetical protein MGN70_005647 [Eutypa lata]